MDIAQIRGITLFIGAFLDLVLLFALWLKTRTRATFHFGWSVLFSILFCFTYGARFFFEHNKLFWTRANWIGILIVPAFIAFVYVLSGKTKYFRLKVFLWYLPGVIIVLLSLFTSYIVKEVDLSYPFLDTPGSLEPLARLYLLVALAVGWFYLLKHYFKSKGFKRLQLKYFILGIGIHSIGGFITAGIIPLIYPKFDYVDISAILTVPGVGLVTYAFVKRQLFEIKVILTEILVVAIALALLIYGLLAQSFGDYIFRLLIFLSFSFLGYLLIRLTQKEIKAKEEAEKLAQKSRELSGTLEQRVKERTKELEKSYNEIKKRSEELEEFYDLTVGRELKIVELKKEIKKLKDKSK
jgi:membrane protein implicated in regulation of membrane protease activity